MSNQDLRFEIRDGVAVITLDRPEQLNTFTGPMGDALGAAYRSCDEDDEVRAVVLTGAGRGFCAGVDLEALKAMHAGGQTRQGPKLGEEDFVRGRFSTAFMERFTDRGKRS